MQKLKNIYHLLVSYTLSLAYGFPIKKLNVIFVTGTDGKTTTSWILYQTLNSLGYKTALLSTVNAFVGKKELNTGLHTTTPAKLQLQKILKQMVKEKVKYAVIEYTAHGIDQHRIVGVNPIATIYTNITNNEHLDYFKTYDNYFNTKAKLVKKSKVIIINKDYKKTYNKLVHLAKNHNKKFLSYSKNTIKDLLNSNFKSSFPGSYNLQNAAAVYTLLKSFSLNSKQIISSLNKATPPKGRFQVINSKPKIIVDFAHTPNSLKNILVATKKHTKGNLILVFGCAGSRDPYKRPVMGKLAAKYANITILTAEDPRNESLKQINNQIEQGFNKQGGKKLIRFDNDKINVKVRKQAIQKALSLAKPNDTVLITGKGHEDSLCFGNKEYNWNDIKETLKILKNK